MTIKLRVVLPVVLVALVACSTPAPSSPTPAAATAPKFDLEEATVADLRKRMHSGQDTSRSIVDKYLARIEAIDRRSRASWPEGPVRRRAFDRRAEIVSAGRHLSARDR